MNRIQRIILILTATIIAIVLLFPPITYDWDSGSIMENSYGFIFKLPRYRTLRKEEGKPLQPVTYTPKINTSVWVIQIFGIVLIGSLLCISQKS
jgi:hypothetical protein